MIHFLFLFIILFAYGEDPNSLMGPVSGPDPGFIIAQSSFGLANRLRVLASYMYIAKLRFDGAHLVFIWDVNEACPGHFLSIFEPIPKVVFASNESRYIIDKYAKLNVRDSSQTFSWIMQEYDIPRRRRGHPTWGEIKLLMHGRFYPRRELMWKAIQFIKEHSVCNASAMHIRQTDLHTLIGRKKITAIYKYMEFVESRPIEEPIFLLTDNFETQQFFRNHYGPKKILIYSWINTTENSLPLHLSEKEDYQQLYDTITEMNRSAYELIQHEQLQRQEQHQLFLQNQTLLIGNNTNSNDTQSSTTTISTSSSPLPSSSITKKVELPIDHRYTTLENTVIDIIIAAHAKVFRPTLFSSLSELVDNFNEVGKKQRGWCTASIYT
jgi:hypothetical protein